MTSFRIESSPSWIVSLSTWRLSLKSSSSSRSSELSSDVEPCTVATCGLRDEKRERNLCAVSRKKCPTDASMLCRSITYLNPKIVCPKTFAVLVQDAEICCEFVAIPPCQENLK